MPPHASLFQRDNHEIVIKQVPQEPGVPIIMAVLITLACTAVSLRFYTRIQLQNLSWDDYAMLCALILYIAYSATIEKISVIVAGQSELPLELMATSLQYVSASECLFCLTMTAIKISLGGFFLRIVIERWQRYVVIGAVVVSCTLNIATVFFFIFMCGVPKSGVEFFEKYIGGQCVSSTHQLIMYYFQACSGTLTDLTFALLPIAILRRSALPLRDKITAGGILLLAALSGIASAVRIKFIIGLASAGLDFYSNVYYTTMWCQIEPGLAITAGSLATLRKLPALIRAHFGWTRDETPPNGSSGDDSLTIAGSPRRARFNHGLSTTASEFSTRGVNYIGPPKVEQVGEGQDLDIKSEMTQQARCLGDSGRPLEDRRQEPKTARGMIYESRYDAKHGGKYDPPYGPNDVVLKEAIEQVDVELSQPAPEVTRFCEADETWSSKGRRKSNRRGRDPS